MKCKKGRFDANGIIIFYIPSLINGDVGCGDLLMFDCSLGTNKDKTFAELRVLHSYRVALSSFELSFCLVSRFYSSSYLRS